MYKRQVSQCPTLGSWTDSAAEIFTSFLTSLVKEEVAEHVLFVLKHYLVDVHVCLVAPKVGITVQRGRWLEIKFGAQFLPHGVLFGLVARHFEVVDVDAKEQLVSTMDI